MYFNDYRVSRALQDLRLTEYRQEAAEHRLVVQNQPKARRLRNRLMLGIAEILISSGTRLKLQVDCQRENGSLTKIGAGV